MNLIQRLRGEQRYSFDQWLNDQMSLTFNGNTLGTVQTLRGSKQEDPDGSLASYVHLMCSAPPAFAAQVKRARVLSQVRFAFRRLSDNRNGPAGSLFTTSALSILERPWESGTTGELVHKLEWQSGVVGNSFIVRRGDTLKVLNPDWVDIMVGSFTDQAQPGWQLDAHLVGYAYWPGGDRGGTPDTLMPSEVVHWSPLPDPLSNFRGMGWLTPAVREIQGDSAATTHKLKFFENGATPNLVVSGIDAPNEEKFREIVRKVSQQHDGVANAYRTLYLTPGANAEVVGSDLKQIDFKATQGAGETRLSLLSEVPAPILGVSEGLAGSSLNAGNFGQARRNWADTWIYPQLQSLAAALAPLVDVPADAELWFDPSRMPILREDAKDAAEIVRLEATTIRTLVDSGFLADSVIAAVRAGDLSQLAHSGLFSVQLQKPGEATQPARSVEIETDEAGRPVRLVG